MVYVYYIVSQEIGLPLIEILTRYDRLVFKVSQFFNNSFRGDSLFPACCIEGLAATAAEIESGFAQNRGRPEIHRHNISQKLFFLFHLKMILISGRRYNNFE